MNKQVIRDALELAKNSAHSARSYDAMVKALAELDTPAAQSARDVVIKYIHEDVDTYSIDKLSAAIQTYADCQVQEAIEKARSTMYDWAIECEHKCPPDYDWSKLGTLLTALKKERPK